MLPQHRNVVEAARAGQQKLLAYTSILKADTNPFLLATEHRGTEEILAGSKVPHILLRNGWYTENYPGTAPLAIQYGVIRSASGNARLPLPAMMIYAAAAAALILRDDPQARPGLRDWPAAVSFTRQEYAELLSRKSGRNVAVQDLRRK